MKKTVYVVVVGVLLPLVAYGQQAPVDLILVAGRIFTADSANPSAEAVAVAGGRIVAVGSTTEIENLAGARTLRFNLDRRVVVPGFNDAHCHFAALPRGVTLTFRSLEPSWEEVCTAVEEAVKQAPPEERLFGVIGSNVALYENAARFELDRVAPDHAVFLRAWTGHGYIVNSKAMRLLRIAEEEPDPVGGSYERVPGTRRINGKLWEYAQWRIYRMLTDQVPDEDLVEELRATADSAVRVGITSLQMLSMMSFERFARLLNKADLPIRVRAIPFSLTSPSGRDLSEIRLLGTVPMMQAKATASGMKWILDGTPFERGAALRRDYSDRAGWCGSLNFPRSEIDAMIRESLDFRQQLLVHCTGDRAIEAVFDAMGKQGAKEEWPGRRLRVEHGDGMIDELIPRARELGVVVVQNPAHFSEPELLHQRWGTAMQPLRSLIEAGVPVALGSDGPMNPFLNILFATTHPYNPKEAITREQAVRAYTYGSAFAEFAENEKGTIAPGRLADLVVLSQDIFTAPVSELPQTTSVLTIVDGKVVFDTKVLKRSVR